MKIPPAVQMAPEAWAVFLDLVMEKHDAVTVGRADRLWDYYYQYRAKWPPWQRVLVRAMLMGYHMPQVLEHLCDAFEGFALPPSLQANIYPEVSTFDPYEVHNYED